MVRNYIVSGIEWDTDGEDIELPEAVHMTVEDDEDIVDALSNEYGFCVKRIWGIIEE